MKKIANFIVKNRSFVLVIMLVLAAVCALLIPNVNVNKDMTKYLPNKSQMKQGLDILDNEFSEAETTQSIRVMFEDLPPAEKLNIQTELENIPYVDSVTYDKDDAEYNKDNYTLYVVNTAYEYDSREELSIESAIKDNYSQFNTAVKSDNPNTRPLPTWVIAVALAILLIILFAMCGSWFEPVIFMMAIGVAVLINMGTNIFLPSVSGTTFSIASILQLVLSMDYSIILMNRYRQERQLHENKLDAMKAALSNSFSSVSSSALTTFVGLLMLIFMSFKIGMDLGLVLAKGVVCSWLCIFTILPALILVFDTLIQKTAKKEPHLPMNKIAATSFRLRSVFSIGFVVLMIGSFILQGITKTTFALSTEDPIAEIFPASNTIVMLYNNEDSEQIQGIVDELDGTPHVKSAVSYPTALGKPNTAADLADIIKDMGSDMEIDAATLNMLYYDYYTEGKLPPVMVGDLINFIAEDVVTNPTFADNIGDEIIKNIDEMKKFSDPDTLTRPMNPTELADFFDMEADEIKQLLVYYYSENEGLDTGVLTLPVFANFVVNDVLTNHDYASMLDESARSQIDRLITFTDSAKMTTPYTYKELAALLDMEPEQMKLLFVYYNALSDSYRPSGMTIPAFVRFVRSDVASNPTFASQFDKDAMAQMNMLAGITDSSTIKKQMTSAQLASMLGMDSSMLDMLFSLYYGGEGADGKTMTLPEFTGFLTGSVLSNPAFASYFDDETKAQLTGMNQMMTAAASGKTFSSSQLAQFFGMEETFSNQVFMMYYGENMDSGAAMTLSDFTGYLASTVLPNPEYASHFDDATTAQLTGMSQMVAAATAGQGFTASQMAQMMRLDESMLQMLYPLYFGGQMQNKTLSPEVFVDYLLSDVVSNAAFASQFDQGTVAQLTMMQTIMKSSLSGKVYSYARMAQLLGMDGSMTKMLFTLRDSYGDISSWKLSMQTTVDFLVSNNSQLGSMIEGENLGQLRMLQKLINGTIAGTQYASKDLASLLDMEAEQLNQLFLLYNSKHGDTSSWKMSTQNFVDFINSDVLSNDNFADKFDADSADSLAAAKKLIDAVVSRKAYQVAELTGLFEGMTDELDENTVALLCLYHASTLYSNPDWRLSIASLFSYLSNDVVADPRFEMVLDESFRNDIDKTRTELDDAIAQLTGTNHSILMLTTNLPRESAETSAFIENVTRLSDERLQGDYYLVGDSVMSHEMEHSFGGEMLLITLLTAISIFIVVAVTFRSIAIPVILVLIVQCGVFLTIAVSGLRGYSLYYLALLIVQCILMGATIDYGILFTSYYREKRSTMGIKEALVGAYNGAIHTILTSGLIVITVTGIVGAFSSDPSIAQICQTLSIGALSASVLILFVLPGLLASFDKFVVRKKDLKSTQPELHARSKQKKQKSFSYINSQKN